MARNWMTGASCTSANGVPTGATSWPRTTPKGVDTERIEAEGDFAFEEGDCWDCDDDEEAAEEEGNWLEMEGKIKKKNNLSIFKSYARIIRLTSLKKWTKSCAQPNLRVKKNGIIGFSSSRGLECAISEF
jgi:hypothetical protein